MPSNREGGRGKWEEGRGGGVRGATAPKNNYSAISMLTTQRNATEKREEKELSRVYRERGEEEGEPDF